MATPRRPVLEAIAPTLAYDAEITRDLSLPTALAAEALADALLNGQRRSLPGQTHDIDPGATAPALAEFLAG